ncbi:uncharacterized protein LOC114355739 [Ostrinia furnacalis]|uniref:uncharacterized protein LOC114355739 n=1 Tax=Ostrinia furnacalis TaxID=93504 RepID=UPI00103EEAE6|nr:uncharacterized protein LOC114355739 [Ostrinia furnacalis]
MRANGRARPACARASLRLCYLLAIVPLAGCIEHGVPIEIKIWDHDRTPLSQMVDITNEFGLKVLAEHNFLNDNNIAFSPYGLMGILVALYEGVDGESSFQIQRGMHLPWNRNVMRIGFRDIHRTLKTYFVPEEGFLAGLALNNENVTFNDSYKKILRFYGFDLDNDQLPTLPPGNDTAAMTTTMSPANGSESTTNPMSTDSQPSREDQSTTTTKEETTPNPNAETIAEVDIRGPMTTTMSPSSAPNAEATTQPETPATTPTAPTSSTTQMMDTTTTIMTTVTTTETSPPSTAEITTTTAATEPVAPDTTPALTTLPDEPTVNNEVDAQTTPEIGTSASTEVNAADTTIMTTMAPSSSVPTETETTSMAESEQTTTTMSTTGMNDSDSTTQNNESSLETLQRRKKSIVDFIFTNPPYIDDYLVYRSYDVGMDLPIPNFDDKMFLANGLRSVQVTYMHYDSILEHAYLPHLEASALRLPLDSERYYLLVVLPSRPGAVQLGRLLSRMARESDLSDVYAALRPRRVRAVVPSFTVKGHVTLTTDLQKLGIRDVFEPRQHDFTPMTRQPGVYVRSIEQAVSVAIRKYRPDEQKKNRYVTNRQPVTFTATYPFLYFVMDASIHVALMAGKMVDPLNTRIL